MLFYIDHSQHCLSRQASNFLSMKILSIKFNFQLLYNISKMLINHAVQSKLYSDLSIVYQYKTRTKITFYSWVLGQYTTQCLGRTTSCHVPGFFLRLKFSDSYQSCPKHMSGRFWKAICFQQWYFLFLEQMSCVTS